MEWNVTLSTSETSISKEHAMDSLLPRINQFIIYTGLGLVSGATGTALAIAAAIIIQAFQSPTTVFWPSIILMAPAAIFLGWGVAWVFYKLAPVVIPSLANTRSDDQAMQIMLAVSGLLSLLQSFMYLVVL